MVFVVHLNNDFLMFFHNVLMENIPQKPIQIRQKKFQAREENPSVLKIDMVFVGNTESPNQNLNIKTIAAGAVGCAYIKCTQN